MSLLLNSLVVLDPTSKYHNLLVNILVSSDGKISKISRNKINVKARKSIDCQKKKVTLGWMDFNANFCDPGFEYKEDLNSSTNLCASFELLKKILSGLFSLLRLNLTSTLSKEIAPFDILFFLNILAKQLTRFYYLKLDKPFKISNKFKLKINDWSSGLEFFLKSKKLI